jgi:hypothetical protein
LIITNADEQSEDGELVLGIVNLNKEISSYLRHTLAMIEDELPGEVWRGNEVGN